MPSEIDQDASPRDAAFESGRIRLLAAEDNAVQQLVLKTLLHHIGLDLTLVENGRLLLEAWRNGDWDLILMDVGMPEMDGASAARAIRAQEAKTGRTRTAIIAVTADVVAKRIAEYRAAGMDSYIGKPISAEALYQAIDAALGKAGSSDEALTRAV
jgi:CheY-like chemotaxis protein